MDRILLADDSPHAQRMGERILRDEGYEVVSVTDGETALLRLSDVDPDVIVADVFLPGHSGIEMCRYVKAHPKHRHARIILTAGLLETFDEAEAKAAGADAIIKKPFEASVVLDTIKPLLAEANTARSAPAADAPPPPATVSDDLEALLGGAAPQPRVTAAAVSEEERVRAAVTIALDAAFPALVEEITAKVLSARPGSPADR